MHTFKNNSFGKTAFIVLAGSILVSGCNNPFGPAKSNRLKGDPEVLQVALDDRDDEFVQLKGENARLRVKAGESPIDFSSDAEGLKPNDVKPETTLPKPINNGIIEYSVNGTYGVHIASYRVRENAIVGWKKP